jgi:rod shape-determining protein MreC
VLDIRQRTGYLFLAVMVGQIILISAQVQSKSGVGVLEAVTFGAFARVQGGVAGVINGVRDVWGNYFVLRGAKVENESLHKQVTELEVRLQEQRALAARSVRLQELLGLRSSATLPFLAAEVIAGNPNPGILTVTIDRGLADGVQADMAVIAARGVVGRVVGPLAAHAARVQLIVDRNAGVGALSERSRSGGVIVGVEGDPPLKMDLVSNLADVQPGDVIVASGVEGIYPKGFAIGVVESSERGSGLYRMIKVRPAVDFSSIEEVLVVLVPPRGATPAEAPARPGETQK